MTLSHAAQHWLVLPASCAPSLLALHFLNKLCFHFKLLIKTFSAAVPVLAVQPEMLFHFAWACDVPWMLSAAPPQPDAACALLSCRTQCCFPAQLDLFSTTQKVKAELLVTVSRSWC